MMKAMPRVIPITPSVAMNGGSRTRTTSAAVKSPEAMPTSTPDASKARVPSRGRRTAARHDAGERHDGAGREIDPAEMITIAAPTAAMP